MLKDWGINPFSYFDDFVIIFEKNKAIGEGAEIAADAIEKDNDKDEEFANTNANYHEESQEEIQKENREDIAASTCNIVVATSKRNHTGKKKAKSFDHSSDLVEQLVGF